MTLIKQPDNAGVIREELRVVGYNNIPCPFTQFLFLSAWSVDLNSEDSLYGSGARNLEADMGPSEGGASIFLHPFPATYSLSISLHQTITMVLQ